MEITMRILTTILIAVAIGSLLIVAFAYSGLYDVSATAPHSRLVSWFLSATSHASVQRRARDIEVPDLDDETLILAGANDYDSMCAACHGAPGMSPEAVGQGLNPPAPDLAEEVLEMTPAELFWVTKNGIKMTGMPAWGVTHDDQTIWPVVAFMTRLPGLDQAAYKELLADAEGVGHHGENTTPEHAGSGDHEHDNSIGPDTVPETADEHDHETHEH